MNASITSISRQAEPERPDRVVLQFGDRVLKGFASRNAWPSVAEGEPSSEQVSFQALGTEGAQEISLSGLKAAFFVKRFDGPGLDELRFHDDLRPMASLWVRVIFCDGEVIEGLVENSSAHVLGAGFFLTPTDPDANHWLIYVSKGQVRDFQVLGLRSAATP